MIRHAIAIFMGLIGAGLALFGVMRGMTATGPASGVRMIVEIEPPLDADSFTMAEKAVRDRVSEKGADTLVTRAPGGRLVVEVSAYADELGAIIERFAKLEIKKGDEVVLEGGGIARTSVVENGVGVDARGPVAVAAGDQLAFVLDGKVKLQAIVDQTAHDSFHVSVPAVDAAMQLVAVLEAGAAHPMHIVRREEFTRPVGFLPRAWPFFAAGGVLMAVAALVAFLRGPRKPA